MKSILILLILLLSSSEVFSNISAQVDRKYAYEGETITLSIRAENNHTSAKPDFTPLKQDFNLGGTSQSSQISIINGHRSDSQTWSVRLQPKKMGVIDIPPITLGQEKTNKITIEIKPIPIQSGSNYSEPIFIKLELGKQAKHFYVQQHIPVIVRLYFKHEISQGHITDPAPKNALLEKLGDDTSYTTQYNGQTYTVYERHYSLFAEKSGQLMIPSASFQGYMDNPNQRSTINRRDPFSSFFSNQAFLLKGQSVSIKSQPITLNIEAHPSQYTGDQWLPAESLTLTDSWSSHPPDFKIGEPVSRTIKLEAKGLVASQIKPLELADISSFRLYAEPAETQTRTDGENVYAQSDRTFTYIPTFAGEQEIPGVKITWWNVLTQKQEIASLPPWKIVVEKSRENTSPIPTKPHVVHSTKKSVDGANTSKRSEKKEEKITDQIKYLLSQYSHWFFAGLALFFSFILVLSNQRKKQTSPPPKKTDDETKTVDISTDNKKEPHKTTIKKKLLKDFKNACDQQDAKQSASVLLKLAAFHWTSNPPKSLGALAEKVHHGKKQLFELDQALYARNHEAWKGTDLYEQFKEGFGEPTEKARSKPLLKPLYPK